MKKRFHIYLKDFTYHTFLADDRSQAEHAARTMFGEDFHHAEETLEPSNGQRLMYWLAFGLMSLVFWSLVAHTVGF